jgi:hypothetical protein
MYVHVDHDMERDIYLGLVLELQPNEIFRDFAAYLPITIS